MSAESYMDSLIDTLTDEKNKFECELNAAIDSISELQKENEQLRDTAKGSLVIVTVAQDKIKKYEEVLGKARDALEEAAETIENMYGTETKQTERYRALIDEVMKE